MVVIINDDNKNDNNDNLPPRGTGASNLIIMMIMT